MKVVLAPDGPSTTIRNIGLPWQIGGGVTAESITQQKASVG